MIFDIGLFHSLWGIRGCVAEYLDGGFGRLAWCVSHIISLAVSLPFAFVSRPRPCFLWPLLIQQSAYGVGLLILLIAALPRILPQLMEPHAVPVVPISVYICGTMLNFFLLYVYWHWYWHVASLWGSAVKVRLGQVVRNANNRSRRDRPMIPKEPMQFPQPLGFDKLAAYSTTAIPDNSTPSPDELKRNNSSLSRIFKEVEAQMNGELPNGAVKVAAPRAAASEKSKGGGLLEVPATSKTVRARYPQGPPVIRAMMKRGKEETTAKSDGAAKRALFKRRASRETSTERELSLSPPRRQSVKPEGNGEGSVSPPRPSESRRNSAIPANRRAGYRRQSTVTINSLPFVIESTASEISTPATPPPPIVATRLTEDAYENRMLRAQEGKRRSSRQPQEETPRRRLPRTPSGTPCGELPRPTFYLQNSEL